MVNRKQFLHLSAASAAGLILPGFLNAKENTADWLAKLALDTARSKGATYADVRITRSGAGIRMLVDGRWGFATTSNLTSESITGFIEDAMSNARSVNTRHQYDLKEKHEVWRCIFARNAGSALVY